MKHNVVVCGRSHTGKSSLAQHIAGDGTCTFGLMPIKAESLAEGQSPASYATTIELAAHRELERLAPGSTPKVHCYWLCVDAAQGATEVDKALFATLKDRALLVATKTDLLSQEGIDRLHANLKEFAPDDRIVLHSNQSCGPAKLGRLTSAIAMANAGDDYAKELLAELAEEAAKEAEEDKSPDNDFTLKDYMHMRGDCLRTQAKEKADKFVYWAAGRAFTIAFVPLPLMDIVPLVANEAYMIHRIGKSYGYELDESAIANFVGCLGASIGGKIAASLLPFIKAPIAAGITYAVGMTAKEYFAGGMCLDPVILRHKFNAFEEAAKGRKW